MRSSTKMAKPARKTSSAASICRQELRTKTVSSPRSRQAKKRGSPPRKPRPPPHPPPPGPPQEASHPPPPPPAKPRRSQSHESQREIDDSSIVDRPTETDRHPHQPAHQQHAQRLGN